MQGAFYDHCATTVREFGIRQKNKEKKISTKLGGKQKHNEILYV